MRRRMVLAAGASILGSGCLRLQGGQAEGEAVEQRSTAGVEGFMHRGDAANSGLTDSGPIPDAVEEAWRLDLTEYGDKTGHPAVYDGYVYVSANNGHVICVSVADREIEWTFERESDAPNQTPAVVDEYVFVADSDNRVYALDTDSGTELWRFQARRDINSELTVADGRVYFGCKDQQLYVLDAAAGDELWTARGYYERGVAIQDDSVVAQEGLNLEVRDAETGDLRWEEYLNHRSTGICLDDGVVYYKRVESGRDAVTVAYDIVAEERLWETETPSLFVKHPTVGEELLFVPMDDGLVALAKETGEQRWHSDIGVAWMGNAAMRAGSKLYCVPDGSRPRERTLYVIDTETGASDRLLDEGAVKFWNPVFRSGQFFGVESPCELVVLAEP